MPAEGLEAKGSDEKPYIVYTGIPQFTLLMWGHIKKRRKQKPRTVKSRVEARVTIQKIKSLGVLQTETCQ